MEEIDMRIIGAIARSVGKTGANAVPVVLVEGQEYFILGRRRHRPSKGKFAPFGGHAKPGESSLETARRESGEETKGYWIWTEDQVLTVQSFPLWPTYFVRFDGHWEVIRDHVNGEFTEVKLFPVVAGTTHTLKFPTMIQIEHFLEFRRRNPL